MSSSEKAMNLSLKYTKEMKRTLSGDTWRKVKQVDVRYNLSILTLHYMANAWPILPTLSFDPKPYTPGRETKHMKLTFDLNWTYMGYDLRSKQSKIAQLFKDRSISSFHSLIVRNTDYCIFVWNSNGHIYYTTASFQLIHQYSFDMLPFGPRGVFLWIFNSRRHFSLLERHESFPNMQQTRFVPEVIWLKNDVKSPKRPRTSLTILEYLSENDGG